MKLVKLNSKYKLHRFGYTHALRFDGRFIERPLIEKIEAYLKSVYPGTGTWECSQKYPKTMWAIHWPPLNCATFSRPYWIGFKNEEDATMCILVAQ
jgi:hypothetical protein